MRRENNSKKSRRRGYRAASILFVALLTVPSVSWGFLKILDRADIADIHKADTELGENRAKSEFDPDIDNIGESVETFYNDRVPFRSILILTNRKINSTIEKPYNDMIDRLYNKSTVAETPDSSDDIVIGKAGQDLDVPKTEQKGTADKTSPAVPTAAVSPTVTTAPEEDPSYFPMRIVNELTILGRDNWLFYGKDKNRDNYIGNNLPDADTLTRYAQVVQTADNLCAANGKTLRVMICPDKESIYPEYYPSVEIVSEYRKPQAIYDYIKKNTGTCILYPKEELLADKDVCRLYYAYDSHWNYAGAYVGACSLLGSLGIDTLPLDSIDHPQITAVIKDLVYIGDLDPADYQDDKDYSIDINPGVKQTSVSDVIGTTQVMDYYSDAADDSYVVLIGDSYYSHMQGYITDHFRHFTFIHKDVMDSEFVAGYLNSADIIVLETVERNSDSVEAMAEKVVETFMQ